MHSVKNVRIRSFSGPYFAAFGLNIQTRKTPNTDTFYAVVKMSINVTKSRILVDRNRKVTFFTRYFMSENQYFGGFSIIKLKIRFRVIFI